MKLIHEPYHHCPFLAKNFFNTKLSKKIILCKPSDGLFICCIKQKNVFNNSSTHALHTHNQFILLMLFFINENGVNNVVMQYSLLLT